MSSHLFFISSDRLHLTDFFTSFFFNNTPTTEIYTLSLHDALPILQAAPDLEPALDRGAEPAAPLRRQAAAHRRDADQDRKSTRLNSSHRCISYAVFCLKKKKQKSHYIRNYIT